MTKPATDTLEREKEKLMSEDKLRPVRYELIEANGRVRITSESSAFLAEHAKRLWPDQEQDPERTGKGWDVQVCE